MYEGLLESGIQLGMVAAYTCIASLLTVAGTFVEYNSVLNATEGQYLMAAWLACIGGVILYFGILLCRRKLLGQYTRLLART